MEWKNAQNNAGEVDSRYILLAAEAVCVINTPRRLSSRMVFVVIIFVKVLCVRWHAEAMILMVQVLQRFPI